ncbi:MAG: hypothetical protein ACI4M5_02620, partial [Christensenellales bacterium]
MQITQGEYQNVEEIFVQNEVDAEVGSVTPTSEKAEQTKANITPTNSEQESLQEGQNTLIEDIIATLNSAEQRTSNQDMQSKESEKIASEQVDDGSDNTNEQNSENNVGGGKKPDTYNEKSNCERDIEPSQTPLYQRQEWKDKTDNFLQSYPIARSFAVEIGKVIAGDDQLARNESCLEIALAKVLSKAYISPQDMILNKDFVDKYVLTNEQIKSTIIDGYIQSLERNSPPKSMMGRGQIILSPPNKPKSIEEAGEIIKKMLI